MQKGSLVTPSPEFLDGLDDLIRKGLIFIPIRPEKDGVYLCRTDVYLHHGQACIGVEEFRCWYKHKGQDEEVHLNTYLWIEVQPPQSISIPELISESVLA